MNASVRDTYGLVAIQFAKSPDKIENPLENAIRTY